MNKSSLGRAQFGAERKPQRTEFAIGKRVKLSDAFVKCVLLTTDVPSFGEIVGVFPNKPQRFRVRWADGSENTVLAVNLDSADNYGMDYTPYKISE